MAIEAAKEILMKNKLVLATALVLLAACSRGESDKAASKTAPAGPAAAPGTVTASLPKRPEFPGFYLDTFGGAADPMNKPATISASAAVPVTGFAFDILSKQPAKTVEIAVDGKPYPTQYGSMRQDVATSQNNPALVNTGFSGALPAGAVTPGEHVVTVRVVTHDGTAYTESPPIKIQAQ
jgi:hypothetical protein